MVEAASLALDYPEVGGRRRGDARDADARRGVRPAAPPARARRLLLRARRRGRRAGRAARPRRRPLARRARRPRTRPRRLPPATSGGCRCACCSTGARSPRRTSSSGERATSTRPRRSSSPRAGIGDDARRRCSTRRVDAVYVALDCDVFEPGELAVFMPEPGGPSLADVEQLLARVAGQRQARRRRVHRARARPGERREAPALWQRRSATDATASSGHRSKLAPWPRSTSRSRPTTSRPLRRSTRTPARAAARTTATTSSSRASAVCAQCGHHFPMRARARIAQLADPDSSWRRPRSCARPIRSASSTSGPTPSVSPRPR